MSQLIKEVPVEAPVLMFINQERVDAAMSAHGAFLEQLNVLLTILKEKGFPQNLAEIKEIIHTNDLCTPFKA
jgi:hypothetical protein